MCIRDRASTSESIDTMVKNSVTALKQDIGTEFLPVKKTLSLAVIDLMNGVAIKGYFNDKAQRLRVEGYFPRLRYENKFIESGMFLCENPGEDVYKRQGVN